MIGKMKIKTALCFVILLAISAFLGGCALNKDKAPALAWSADNSFGDAGFAGVDLSGAGPTSDYLNAIASDSQNRIIVTGSYYDIGGYMMYAARLTAAGVLDSSFGSGGVFRESVQSIGRDIKVLANGNILIGGYRDPSSDYDAAVWCFDSDGQLVSVFGANGIATHDIGGNQDKPYKMAIDQNGNIYLAGSTYDGSNEDMAIWRFTSGGVLDTTFDSPDGYLTDDSAAGGTGTDIGFDLLLDGSGRAVIAGRSRNPTNSDYTLWRFLPSGAVDNAFNGTGTAVFDSGNLDESFSLTIDGEGRITQTGFSVTAMDGYDIFLLRYLADGSPDPDFGNAGIVQMDFYGKNDEVNDSLALTGNRIAAAGRITLADDSKAMALYLFDNNGNLVNDFGENGVITETPGENPFGTALALDQSGRLIVGGYFTNTNGDTDFAVWRYALQ